MFTFDEKDGSADDQELSALFAQAPCVELTDPVVAIEPVKPRPSKKTLEEALDAESLRDKNPKISQKSRSERQKAQEEARAKAADRTLFIGNLPSAILSSGTSKTLQKALHRSFSVFGSIESIRYRSIAFDHSAKNKKAAFLKGQFHAEAEACNAYLVYKGKESVSTAIASMNGLLWEGRHLRVDSCLSTDPKAADKKVPSLQPITKQCVFVGNLSFDASDEDLWGFFEDVGDIGESFTCPTPCIHSL